MRLFIAIPIVFENPLQEIISNCKKMISYSRVKWVEVENMHLTLKFLGEVETYYVNSINTIIENCIKKIKATHINVKGIGYFAKKENVTSLFVDFEENNMLSKLHSLLDEELTELGFKKSEHAFKLHLTLGRIKRYDFRDDIRNKVKQFTFDNSFQIKAEDLVLFKSDLKESGPVYSKISEFQL